jgi:acyl-CoA dehydrogenase
MALDQPEDAPTLDNQYDTDRVLQSYVRRRLPEPLQKTIEPELEDMGRLAAGELREQQRADRGADPHLARWDSWGSRIDDIDETDLWARAQELAAERGVVASAYEQEHGRFSRVHQMALAYLFIPSTDMYGLQLAMTDGAARTLLEAPSGALAEGAVSHFTSRDPETVWTAADWMTDAARGAGPDPLTARRDEDGAWRLYGRKQSARGAAADAALTAARPADASTDAAPRLFYVPLRSGEDLQSGLRDGLRVNRLTETLGARKLPTADLAVDGAVAYPVRNRLQEAGPMRSVMHSWSAITATSLIRRGLALARDGAQKREAFGEEVINHPLHQDTLADTQATLEGAFHLSVRLAELMGIQETGQANEDERALLQILAPIANLTTARQAVSETSTLLGAFGQAGYDEATGLPSLLRNAQGLQHWGGTTNELALDLMRRLRDLGSIRPVKREVERCVNAVEAPTLVEAIRPAVQAVRDAIVWLKTALQEGEEAVQAGARRFAVTLGSALQVLYTARHAQWSLQEEQDGRSAAAAERLAARRINHVADLDSHGAYVLVWDFNCPTLFDCHAAGDGAAENEPVLEGFADVL